MPLWAEEPVLMAGRTRSSGHRDGFFVAYRSPDRPLAAFSIRESHAKSRKVTESQMPVSGCAIFVAGKFSERLSAGPSSPTRSPCRSTQTQNGRKRYPGSGKHLRRFGFICPGETGTGGCGHLPQKDKLSTFIEETKCRSAVHLTLVTT